MENSITFLGTAGARIMVANQIQASGGMWLNLAGTEILIDPGPGSIVQSTKRKLRADQLKAIIISHRHLDHAGDLNIMVEAMTQGGFEPRGRVFLPSDALGPEPVLFSYLIDYLDKLEVLREGQSYGIDSVTFSTPVRHKHSVETYGLKFTAGERSFAYIADSRYFDGLIESYKAELIIINLVFIEPRDGIAHLSLKDAERIINGIRPKAAILNHFGMSVWKARPWEVAEGLTQKTGIKVIAARDGMKFDLANLAEKESV
ncbi:MAG: MBL fold metallo-hydrolase [Dehalococcoidales bacterium]|nr:MBL fold metallo-hydrolase [Dehalococcoidales bacterium]